MFHVKIQQKGSELFCIGFVTTKYTGGSSRSGCIGCSYNGRKDLTDGYAYDIHSGTKLHGHTSTTGDPYGESAGTGDVVAAILDLDKGNIEFTKNGKSQGIAFTNVNGSFYPAVSFYHKSSSVRIVY